MTVPLYTLAGNPYISPKVKAMIGKPDPPPADLFTVQQIIAERLLGATTPVYTGDAAAVAEIAIVRQMNFQVEQGLDPFTQVSAQSGQSKQSVIWRDRFLDPVAAQLWASITDGAETPLDALLAQFSGELRSHRTDDGGSVAVYVPNLSDRLLERRYIVR